MPIDNSGNNVDLSGGAGSWITVQNQLFEIKGILNTIVQEHARRLTSLDDSHTQLRNDLTIVKETAAREVSTLREKWETKWDEGQKAGQAELTRINRDLTNLENGRKENREDIQELRDKSAQTWPRILSILSAIAAVGMFIIGIINKVWV